ncbi:MAG: prephenate/arogenate dehydrogenase family protein [Parvularculales bacterium]
MVKPLFQRLALIGLGLIGSSIAHAVQRKQLAGHITGYAPSAETRARAKTLGFCDSLYDTPQAAVEGADLVILCAPVGALGDITRTLAPALASGAIISDVGSVKASVIRDMAPFIPEGVHFVPAHPVAGTEESGPDAGFAELFDGRWCILTPTPTSDVEAVQHLKTFWIECGAMVEVMEPDHHDLVLAITSHVPHLIAYNIVGTAARLGVVTNSEVTKYAAGGFRDFTRIASSDPVMWRDIFLNNRTAVLDMLDRFQNDMDHLKQAIERSDGKALQDLFTSTRNIRQRIIEAGQESPEPDFARKSTHTKTTTGDS